MKLSQDENVYMPDKGNLNVDLGSVLVLKIYDRASARSKDIEGPGQKG